MTTKRYHILQDVIDVGWNPVDLDGIIEKNWGLSWDAEETEVVSAEMELHVHWDEWCSDAYTEVSVNNVEICKAEGGVGKTEAECTGDITGVIQNGENRVTVHGHSCPFDARKHYVNLYAVITFEGKEPSVPEAKDPTMEFIKTWAPIGIAVVSGAIIVGNVVRK